ncbi:MAG: glycosyltransferase, partial [Chloroflexota bacterium]
MHIVHVTPRYLPARGGAERYIAELSERLVQDGKRVTVLTSTALQFEHLWDPAARSIDIGYEAINGVDVYRLPLSHLPAAPLSYHMIRRFLWWLGKLAPQGRLNLVANRLSQAAPRLIDQAKTLETLLENSVDLIAGLNVGYEGMLLNASQVAGSKKIPFVIFPLTHLGVGPRPGSDERAQFYTLPQQVGLVVQRSNGLVAMTDAEKNFYVTRGYPEHR